jgi:hypothetical protein
MPKLKDAAPVDEGNPPETAGMVAQDPEVERWLAERAAGGQAPHPAAQVPGEEPLQRTELNSSLPVVLQWLLSLAILGGIAAWLAIGSVAEGTLGEDDCPVDSWLVPAAGGLLAYVAAFGFFSVGLAQTVKDTLPLVVVGGFAALFAWRGALLPYVVGCSSCSFMVILCVFNAGVNVEGPNGKAVVDYSYKKYRGYVAFMLVSGNGIMNGLGFIFEHEFGWSPWTRWFLATFSLPILMLIPALLNIVKGLPNGQYNVPGPLTFIRLFISTRLGIYFCMYYLVHYHFERLITKEVYELNGWVIYNLSEAGNLHLLPCDSSATDDAAVAAVAAVAAEEAAAPDVGQISGADIDLWATWEAPTAWIITGVWAFYNIVKKGLPTAIGAELCCCPFAKFPEKKLVDAGEAKAAGFARWFYWSTGLIIGTLLMACSLPEVLLGWEDPPPGSPTNQVRKRCFLSVFMLKMIVLPRQARDKHRERSKKSGVFSQTVVQEGLVTNGFILWWKLILGIGMVLVHTGKKRKRAPLSLLRHLMYAKNDHFTKTGSGQMQEKLRKEWCFLAGMMRDRTLVHNHTREKGKLYPASAKGGSADDAPFRETEDGALFNGRGMPYKTDADWRSLKAVCQLVQIVHYVVWIPYWFQHGRGSGRPPALVWMDAAAIALLALVNITRIIAYAAGCEKRPFCGAILY